LRQVKAGLEGRKAALVFEASGRNQRLSVRQHGAKVALYRRRQRREFVEVHGPRLGGCCVTRLICGNTPARSQCDALGLIRRLTMTHATTRIILEEHDALSVMLRSILLLLAQHRRQGTLPDFAALRAMLFYMDEFPEKRHHRKESQLLFPKLRARTPLSRDLLDHLDEDHARGERNIRDLEHTLLGFEMVGEPRRQAFERAAERYVDFYLAHMAMEEQQILPLAERVLTEEDWVELDEAFTANRDPLTGHEPEADYRALFTRIRVHLAILGEKNHHESTERQAT